MISIRLVSFLILSLIAFPPNPVWSAVPTAENETAAVSPALTTSGKGVQVDFFAEPLDKETASAQAGLNAGQAVRLGFKIMDAKSGYGVSDLHPAGWIFRRQENEAAPDKGACKENVKKFARGGVSVQTEADLNNFYVVTINQDNTVAIFNPSVNLATSNLLALIALKEKAANWLFDEPQGLMYITLPDAGKVAVVDIFTRQLAAAIKVGSGPRAIGRLPDSRFLWVGNDQSKSLSIIDTSERKVVKSFRMGPGPYKFAFDPKMKWVFALSSGDGKVTVFRITDLAKIKTFKVPPGDLRFAFSELARAIYVADRATGGLHIISVESGDEFKTIDLKPGITEIKVTPDGRFVFILNEQENRLDVLDTSLSRVIQSFHTWEKPYQVEFSLSYAYVRYKENPNISLIQLSALKGENAPPFAEIPLGTKGPGALSDLVGMSQIAILPEGAGAMVVGSVDKTVYLYMEGGMMGPSNSFKTYTSTPLGVTIYDHSLTETNTAGVYDTTVRLPEGGTYDIYFLLDSPLMTSCFAIEVKGPVLDHKKKGPAGVFTRVGEEAVYREDEVAKIRFKLVSSEDQKPISGRK
ncbi:MAG: YncE family protein, partial [Nitrospinaceae bacterium]